MKELTRFQQLRPAQRLQDEQKKQIGLTLYGTAGLSQLATQLTAASNDEYLAIARRFVALHENYLIVTTKPAVTVSSLYHDLTIKTLPISVETLKKWTASVALESNDEIDPEWVRLADNLILSLLLPELQLNCQYDLQLIIRVLYILSLCVQQRENKLLVAASASDDLLVRILSAPILLPARLIRDRCSRKCISATYALSLPVELAEIAQKPLCPDKFCPCDTTCKSPSTFCLCIRPYVGDLFIIKESLARYESGEIADIQNVLAGESKSRHHRTLTRSEQTSETDNETNTSEERDHQVDEKSALQSEVKKTVDSKLNVDAGVTASFKYGNSITVTPHANVTVNNAKSQSNSQALAYSKDVVDRSVSQLQTKVRTVAISTIITETEEQNKDSIDNTAAGSGHRAGIFYWVNKITHAQVYNYGKHMMFDLIIPEPAALFKVLMQANDDNTSGLQEPPKPDITINSIHRDTFSTLLGKYSISTTDDISPPADTIAVSAAFSQNVPQGDSNKATAFSSSETTVEIPEDYKAMNASYQVICYVGDPNGTDKQDVAAASVNLGALTLLDKSMDEWRDGAQQMQQWREQQPNVNVPMGGETGTLTVAIAGFSSLALSLSGSVSINCKLTDAGYAKWRCTIFNLIMADYNRKLDAYKSATGNNVDLVQIKGRNPFLNREIERNEFKRHIISILMCNYFNGIGSMQERVAPCSFPEPDFKKLAADSPLIQFFEQVFEWDYMTYLFYHSMWARKCKWADLINEDSGDPLFDKFLMSGSARVQVPIQPGMESVFCWFLKRNEIWGESGEPPLPGDDDYISMIQEMKEADQGDYSDRPGLIEATQDSDQLKLTMSTYYYDLVHKSLATLNVFNDIDREILVNFKVYRIVAIDDAGAADHASWNLTIDPPYTDASAKNLKHAVGAVYVGAPWEIVTPTELVYLRNDKDKLPVYPLT